jgi:membrane protease subunit (stomatin/prohibitin family)
VGGVAHTAAKAGAQSAAPDAHQSAAEQPPAEPVPQQSVPSADESMEELAKLKGLLDSGVLTQAEFDVQKQKILQTM